MDIDALGPCAMTLRALAYAKVNLCLFLGPVRPDGRHQLVTLMEPLSLADELTVETSPDGADTVVCPGVDGPNLVDAALAAMRSSGWDAPPVKITIDKRIPVAGGMGGGSADAAATLRLGAELAPVTTDVSGEIARSLGSDVAGLLDPGAVVGTGAGEVVSPVAWSPSHAFVILPQPFGLSTAEVYAEADRLRVPRSADDLEELRRALLAAVSGNAGLPPSLLVNDLQAAALSLAPQIDDALRAVRDAGADHATVCGSGPTVAGVFWRDAARERARGAVGALAGEHPSAVVAEPVRRPAGAVGGAHLRGRAQSPRR